MSFPSRPYQSEADLYKIQATTAEWIAQAGFQGYLNPADIALRLFNGNRKYDPREIVRLWEDAAGHLIGCGMVYPAWDTFEILLHPNYRHLLALEILDWAQDEIIKRMKNAGRENQAIQLNVFEGDTERITLLEGCGYSRRTHASTISVRHLGDPIPEPQLPDGFSIRSLQGEYEADILVALINDSFVWRWTAEDYHQVMRSPSYRSENELVVVAPDGRFAASCILLPDTRNHTCMFENVGTRGEFRRLGLAKALLCAGLGYMRSQGFTEAMVPHGPENTAATALYASVGFRPAYSIFCYAREVNRSIST